VGESHTWVSPTGGWDGFVVRDEARRWVGSESRTATQRPEPPSRWMLTGVLSKRSAVSEATRLSVAVHRGSAGPVVMEGGTLPLDIMSA
jgi:hypothetical protein